MKIDALKDIIKRYPKEYAAGYAMCKKHNGDIRYYRPMGSPNEEHRIAWEKRIAWTRGWGDRQSEGLHGRRV